MNYTIYHLHSDLSSGVTNIDSITKYHEYIAEAKRLGMTALGFSEHGNIFEWWHKKQEIEKAGMKYIHAIEAYITDDIDTKVRDNYHCVLIAKNYEGFKEINKLSSKSFNRKDGHFYYAPRITMEELENTSDNIIVTTACLGGILYKGTAAIKKRFVKFLSNNSHRCYLEIQHHKSKNQVNYNKALFALSEELEIPLIAGTDTHCLNEVHADARRILQKSKKVFFSDEDDWDLTFKSYDELIKAYEDQDALPEEVYLEAINNTNQMAEMVETFEINTKAKYPQLYDNSEEVFKRKIAEGVITRGINHFENYQEYKDRIQYEYDTYKYNGAIDFMLLEEDYKSQMRKRGIHCGYSRGSVSGSIIAYILGITEIDSIKHGLNFERFMNKERVSLADVDSDWYSKNRGVIKDYLTNKEGLYCCDIITFNTIALKGAIRDVARALEIPLDEVDVICKNIETSEEKYREIYPELFKYVDLVNGVIVSVGNHPAGMVVSPVPVDEHLGIFYSSSNEYPISQLNMKEIDSQNFVKLDILGLDNMGLIDETCKLAGIERLTPGNTPADDVDVWKSIRDDTTCIFQWESETAGPYLRRLLSDETISKIKAVNPNFSYMDLLSIGNGAIRPAGASYREELAKGEFRDNGHDALNEFLSSTLGFLVFQEQIIQFLHDFCGYTMGQADIVRRHFAKKTGTEQDIPQITSGFINTMKEKYNVDKAEAEKLIVNFIKVIEDASDYLFSLNHADPYSWIGYICGYLRYHYPYEFITTALNIFENKEKKTLEITNYARSIGIDIQSIKFRYSLPEYTFDKDTKSIYKGMKSIKYLNKRVSNELYNLKNDSFSDFYDLLNVLKTTSIDSRQLEILIKLDFFSEFGNPNQLLAKVNIYNAYSSRKQINKNSLTDVVYDIVEAIAEKETPKQFYISDAMKLVRKLDDTEHIKTPVKDIIKYENECLGYIRTTIPELPANYAVVIGIDGKYANKNISLYRITDGTTEVVKVKGKQLRSQPLNEGDIIKTIECSEQKKWRKSDDGKFYQIEDTELVLTKWKEVR